MRFSKDTPKWKETVLSYYVLTCWTYYDLIDKYKKYQHKRKIKRILRDNKDIAEISKLAGIRDNGVN
jgi:hypothetical protein